MNSNKTLSPINSNLSKAGVLTNAFFKIAVSPLKKALNTMFNGVSKDLISDVPWQNVKTSSGNETFGFSLAAFRKQCVENNGMNPKQFPKEMERMQERLKRNGIDTRQSQSNKDIISVKDSKSLDALLRIAPELTISKANRTIVARP